MEHKKQASKIRASRRLQLFAACGALLLIMSALFTWLMYASFESQYKDMQGQYYALVTGQVINNVEDNLHYGKELERYYGMDSLLAELSEYMPEGMELFVLGREGNTLYSYGPAESLPQRFAESGLIASALASGQRGVMESQEFDGASTLFAVPIYNADDAVEGCLALRLENAAYQQAFDSQLRQMILTAAVIVAVSLAMLLLIALLVPLGKGAKGLTIACSLLLILSIFAQGAAGYQQLQQEYRNTMMDCGNGIANYMGNIIEQVHEKGIAYDEMDGLSTYLASRIENTSLLWNMKLVHMVADSDAQLMRESQSTFSIPLNAADSSNYLIQFEISNSYMNEILLQLFLTFFLTIIVMLVMMAEINRLPQLWLERDMEPNGPKGRGGQAVQLRLATFLVFTANYLSIPYSAAVIRAMGAPLFGLTLDATASLPVTVEVFLTMAGMLLLQRRLGRFANKVLGMGAFGLLIVGNLISAFAPSPLMLLAGRAVCGVGMAVYKIFANRAASYGEGADVEANVGAMNAGVLGGIMCGGSLGAIISEALGNSMTYIFTLSLLALTGVLMLSILSRDVRNARDVQEKEGGSALKLLLDKRVLLTVLCVILPLNIGLMFIVSFLPAFVQDISSGGLITSYGYIVNGLAGIYLGQALAAWTKGRLSNRASLCIVMGLGAVSLLLLGSGVSIAVAALAASALMGIFDVYGNPVATSAYLRLPAVAQVNTAAALTTMMVIGSLAQTIAPMLFSLIIANMESVGAMAALLPAIGFLAADILLIALFMRDKGQSSAVRG